MRISGIYKIESLINPERCYIGSGVNLQIRKRVHFWLLKNNKHRNRKLQNHYNKYGKEDLVFVIIEPCFPEFLVVREQYYIDKLEPWFNICLFAYSRLGAKATEETKQKLRQVLACRDQTGKNNPMFGKRITEEHKLRIREANIARIRTGKEKARLKRGMRKGLKNSEEHNRKMGESKKGIKHTEETKCKMRKPHKKFSDETKQKMREAWIIRKKQNENTVN